MEKIAEILEDLGISQKAVKVYLACLEMGTATVHEIASKADLKRTTVYHLVDELKEFGLINENIKKGKTIIIPENPHILDSISEDKLRQAKINSEKINTAIPSLMGIYNLPSNKPKVKFYEGIEGIKKVYHNIFMDGHDIYGFSDYDKMLSTMDPKYMFDLAKKRASKNIFFYNIAMPSKWNKKIMGLNKKDKREIKIIKNVKFETEINIYGNKVAIISFKKPYSGIIMEDKAISQTHLSLWKALWATL